MAVEQRTLHGGRGIERAGGAVPRSIKHEVILTGTVASQLFNGHFYQAVVSPSLITTRHSVHSLSSHYLTSEGLQLVSEGPHFPAYYQGLLRPSHQRQVIRQACQSAAKWRHKSAVSN